MNLIAYNFVNQHFPRNFVFDVIPALWIFTLSLMAAFIFQDTYLTDTFMGHPCDVVVSIWVSYCAIVNALE